MIRPLRQRLRRIRYYSASRNRTVWTRALDAVLFVTFFLALPLTLASEAMWSRSTTLDSVYGGFERDETGQLTASVADQHGQVPWTSARPVGDWILVIESMDRGWPYPSLRRSEAPKLVVHLFDEPEARPAGDSAVDLACRVEIERVLASAGRQDVLDEWRRGTPRERQRSWLGSLLNAAVWWIGAFAASVVVIRVLALGAHLARARRAGIDADRRRRGRCPSCNYDLRGLEFHERCPECGALQE